MILTPPVLFSLIWALVLLLFSTRLTYFLEPISSLTIVFILASSLLFFSGWFTSSLLYKGKKRFIIKLNYNSYEKRFSSNKVKKRFIYTFYFWAALSLIETIYYGNLPLLSSLNIGPKLRYTEYGFPGLHGLLNAMFFLLCIYFMCNYLITRNNKSLRILSILMLWPFLLLTRMMIIAVFLQLFFSYLMIFQPKFSYKKLTKVIVLAILVLLIFGFLGDLRNGREHLLELANFKNKYPDWLPSGFAWFYLYLTTPLNNINYSIDTYIYPSAFPFQITSKIFPSFIRGIIFDNFNTDREQILIKEAFNVSTVFLPILKDFGYYLGSFVFYFVGSLSFVLCKKSINEPRYVIFWIALLYSIIISVFSNHMFHLVFWSEAALGYLLLRK